MEFRWVPSNCSWEEVLEETSDSDVKTVDIAEDLTDLNQLKILTVFAVCVVGFLIVGTMLLSMCYKNDRLLEQLPCWKIDDGSDEPEVWIAGIKPRSRQRRGGLSMDKIGALHMFVASDLLAAMDAPRLATQGATANKPSLLNLHNMNGDNDMITHHDTSGVSPVPLHHDSLDDPLGLLHAQRTMCRTSSPGEESIFSFEYSGASAGTTPSMSTGETRHFLYDVDTVWQWSKQYYVGNNIITYEAEPLFCTWNSGLLFCYLWYCNAALCSNHHCQRRAYGKTPMLMI